MPFTTRRIRIGSASVSIDGQSMDVYTPFQASLRRLSGSSCKSRAVHIQDDSRKNDEARDEPPRRLLRADLRESCAQTGDYQHAEKCVHDGTAPARQTRAADDARGDGLQFGAGACVRIGGRQTSALQNSGAGREQSAQAENGDL